jgi:ribosome-associated heat shock protein Hsp15
MRVDKWLWAARFFKTRSQAVEAIDGGKVDVNGERAKRSKQLQAGDAVRLRNGPYEHLLTVKGLSERRGPASEAQLLYEESEESRAAREARALQMRSMNMSFAFDQGRPTKKERRELDRFRERRGGADG